MHRFSARNASRLAAHDVDPIPQGCYDASAGWSSQVARWAHNPKVASSNLAPATKSLRGREPRQIPLSTNLDGLAERITALPRVWGLKTRQADSALT